MTSRVKGLTPESFETLRREIGALKRQLANQERRLATVSTRRHEAVWPGEYGVYGEAYAGGGTVSSATLAQVDFSAVTEAGLDGFGADAVFQVTSGYLTALRSGVYAIAMIAYMTIKHTRDQRTRLSVYLQDQDKDSAVWATSYRLWCQAESNFPDVAVNSNGFTGAVDHATVFCVPLSKGDKLRVVTEGTLSSGSWPSNTSAGPIYLQYLRSWRAQPAPGTVF